MSGNSHEDTVRRDSCACKINGSIYACFFLIHIGTRILKRARPHTNIQTCINRNQHTLTYIHSHRHHLIFCFSFSCPSVFIFPCDLLLQQALIVKQKIFLNLFYLLFLQLYCAIIVHFLINYQLQYWLFGDQKWRYYFEKLRIDMLISYGHNI